MSYTWIERNYGRAFTPRQIVILDELGGIEGSVLRTKGNPQYVRIEYWSAKQRRAVRGDFHPLSVTPLRMDPQP